MKSQFVVLFVALAASLAVAQPTPQPQSPLPAQTQLAPPDCVPANQAPKQSPAKGHFGLPRFIRNQLPKVCDKFGVCVDPNTHVPIPSGTPKPPCPVAPATQTPAPNQTPAPAAPTVPVSTKQ